MSPGGAKTEANREEVKEKERRLKTERGGRKKKKIKKEFGGLGCESQRGIRCA